MDLETCIFLIWYFSLQPQALSMSKHSAIVEPKESSANHTWLLCTLVMGINDIQTPLFLRLFPTRLGRSYNKVTWFIFPLSISLLGGEHSRACGDVCQESGGTMYK